MERSRDFESGHSAYQAHFECRRVSNATLGVDFSATHLTKKATTLKYSGNRPSVPMCFTQEHYLPDQCLIRRSISSRSLITSAGLYRQTEAVRAGVKQFIYASSGSVYGVKDEDEVTEDLRLEPISEYNKTKMCAERILLSFADKMAIQIVRPATVCGPSLRMRFDVSVNMLIIQAMERSRITVFGGDQTRPNVGLKDLVVGLTAHGIVNPPRMGR